MIIVSRVLPDVPLYTFFFESPREREGTPECLWPKSKNNEAIRGTCSFSYGTYSGYVRDWCAESGQGVLGFARKRTMMASETPLSDVRFLTVAEVATIMRVSKMTVYRLVHSGELEAIRVGRSFRVPEQAVNQYLRAAYVGTV